MRNLKEMTSEELREMRNNLVREADKKLDPMREQRANKEEVDWKLWDEIEKERNIATNKVDYELYLRGDL